VKDALERKLHKLVCTGQLDLKTAQRETASDWIEAYKKYGGGVFASRRQGSLSRANHKPPEQIRGRLPKINTSDGSRMNPNDSEQILAKIWQKIALAPSLSVLARNGT